MPDALSTVTAPGKGRSFASRLLSTVALLVLMGSALAFHLDWPWVVIVVLFGMLGTMEYVRLNRDDDGACVHGNFLLLVSAAYWIAASWMGFQSRGRTLYPHEEAIPFWLDALAVLVVMQGSFALALRGPLEGERTMRRIMGAVFGFAYSALTGGFFLRILFFRPEGAHVLLLVILVVKFSDIGAYVTGTWLGRHKMIPHISPAKSWEGFGGAIAGSCVAMAVFMLLDAPRLVPLTWAHALAFPVLLCLVGVMGDLAESVLKRCHQV
ncbi:MAG: phosphatidate cytidylyltransferase, partial [Verrucomicrobiaceae bacterium]